MSEKKSFRDRFKSNYSIAKELGEKNRAESLEEAKQKGKLAYYNISTAHSQSAGLPRMLAIGTEALIRTIKDIYVEKSEKTVESNISNSQISEFAETKTKMEQAVGASEDKKTSAPKLEPIDFSKIDFNHDGKPDIEQNIEEVMKVDVKQYIKEENRRDYIGDFDFAEDEPEIQEEQQVVQNYRSNSSRDDYDRDER